MGLIMRSLQMESANSGPLPEGLRAAKWNGGFVEGQYIISPQWIVIAR